MAAPSGLTTSEELLSTLSDHKRFHLSQTEFFSDTQAQAYFQLNLPLVLLTKHKFYAKKGLVVFKLCMLLKKLFTNVIIAFKTIHFM